jgi:lipoic acid synthetase
MARKHLIELPVIQSPPAGTPNEALPYPRDDKWKEQPKKPSWLRVKLQTGESYSKIRQMTEGLRLNTVCQEARCPNIFECWSEGTATFMVMGDICTRACGFCAVKTGRPEALDPEEPEHVAEAVEQMRVSHAVITSVDRDDLPDLGSGHFAAVIRAVRERNPSTKVEVLIPDFQGKPELLETILDAKPDVLNHNTETVPRLHRRVRTRARYHWTLGVLRQAAAYRDSSSPDMFTKTGLMLGLGESLDEVLATIKDIRDQGTDILTVGQYMRPSLKHLPVERYWSPEEFDQIGEEALALGFKFVESGPLVRSSYHAGRHRHGALQTSAKKG